MYGQTEVIHGWAQRPGTPHSTFDRPRDQGVRTGLIVDRSYTKRTNETKASLLQQVVEKRKTRANHGRETAAGENRQISPAKPPIKKDLGGRASLGIARSTLVQTTFVDAT